MHIESTYFNHSASVPPVSFPTGDGDPSQAEMVTQAALMLGYLALLCKGSPAPGTDDYAEIQRIYNLYTTTYKKYLDQDKTIGPMVEQAYATLVDGSGNITSATEAAFFAAYTTTDETKSPPYIILNSWLSAGMYTFDPNTTSPDTYFALSMFMISAGLSQISSLGLSGDLNNFMSEGENGGEFPCYEWTQFFLFAYLDANASTMHLTEADLVALMPPATPNTAYNSFLSNFNSQWAIWQKNPPANPQEALAGIISNWNYFIP